MENNEQLVDHLISSGVLRSPSLINAFEKCDRILFIPDAFYPYAYEDRPLPIGRAQTISQPYTVAIMLELLQPNIGDRILDIGSGSGWTTALLTTAVGASGYVEGIEIVPELVEYGRKSLQKMGIDNASISQGSSSILGKPGEIFDRILVSASSPEIPDILFDQLKPNGRLVVPVQNSIWCLTKKEDGTVDGYELSGFQFVPLIV